MMLIERAQSADDAEGDNKHDAGEQQEAGHRPETLAPVEISGRSSRQDYLAAHPMTILCVPSTIARSWPWHYKVRFASFHGCATSYIVAIDTHVVYGSPSP